MVVTLTKSLPYTLLLIITCESCLPAPGFFSPGYVPPYYPAYSAGAAVYEPPGIFPLGPFRSEGTNTAITTVKALNCHGFNEICRWSNTNEDELDWKVRSAAPESETWFNTLDSVTLPDQSASVLFTSSANGWEVGQLVSDQIPCIAAPLQLTATVWRTTSGSRNQQPRLQVCSRNVRSDIPISNCQKVPIQNGVPVTVDIPAPNEPLSPAQIILMGDNFSGSGGAIYVQDIIVNGRIEQDCALAALDNRVETVHKESHWRDTDSYAPLALPGVMQHYTTPFPGRAPARMPNVVNEPSLDSFYDTCTALSCNPAETECKWYAEKRGWITAVGQRFSNPLTGIQSPPPGIRGFLVAPFANEMDGMYQMTSPSVTISSGLAPTYFCFYEFLTTEGARLSICTDKHEHNCFYIRSEIEIEDAEHTETNRKWRYRCAEMPGGTYEVSVTAENRGLNKGDVGFVPVIVTHNLHKNSGLCEQEYRFKRRYRE